jgi:5-methylcytosine-specific restriction endonuclease McrA
MANVKIYQKEISDMAKEIGLPGNARFCDVARAYADRLGFKPNLRNNKDAKRFLLKVKNRKMDIHISVTTIKTDICVKNQVVEVKKQDRESDYSFITSKEFLKSYEWRSLRMKVLKNLGRKCSCCGATPETGSVMHVDHIKPRRKYPELALEESNLQVLCEDCNHGKGNWDETDWRVA